MRGEHGTVDIDWNDSTGSSPHARGTHAGVVDHARGLRIIPACAGNTSARMAASNAVRDHPRMRGEHTKSGHTRMGIAGSSPHARGTRSWPWRGCPCSRIIPACAGNTPQDSGPNSPTGDHPRMRGEHHAGLGVALDGGGSSPHARGTHLQSVAISRDIWIRHHPFPSLSFSALFAESPTSATPL